jgi:two-component system, chemotaxis family, CheB/CheR fusion protein
MAVPSNPEPTPRPRALLRPPRLPVLARILTAPVATLLIGLIQAALLPEPKIAPFVLFYLGVAVASWLAGRWAGVATAVLSAGVANYFFIPPYDRWTFAGPPLTATAMFLLSATATALLSGSLRDAMAAAEQAAEERQRLLVVLAEQDRMKNEFLGVLSHELRNPLAPLRNSLYILEHAAPDGDAANRARAVMGRQVGHLSRLVDDLLDVTRISRGKIQLRLERLELGELVRKAVEDHRSLFADADVELTVDGPPGQAWVQGDGTRLAQAVGNLLHNAAKFTPSGGRVVVSVTVREQGRVAVSVRDTGVGIDPAVLPRLFVPFTQGDATLDRTKGGLGLGLALVKGLVEEHGGTVAAKSEGPGQGAELTIVLPLHPDQGADAQPAVEPPSRSGSRRLLVIEDNVDAADSLRLALELSGHTVEVAYGGAEGIDLARSFRPQVVLCDIGLPRMNGYEVARALRAEPALAATQLVALTGYAAPEDVAKSRAAGFDAHLAKPPSIAEIDRLVRAQGTG